MRSKIIVIAVGIGNF